MSEELSEIKSSELTISDLRRSSDFLEIFFRSFSDLFRRVFRRFSRVTTVPHVAEKPRSNRVFAGLLFRTAAVGTLAS